MELRLYRSEDCPALAQIFYDTVHTVNARDYTPEQLNAWADGHVDLTAWDTSFLAHHTLVAEENGEILGFADMDGAGYLDRLEERLIDAGSAVAGCGPAFLSLFLEALADGGVTCGLPRQKALTYAAKMAEGTAKLMLETNQHPGVMKDAVCSPAGSTIAGVRALEEHAFRAAAMDAVISAMERNRELGK